MSDSMYLVQIVTLLERLVAQGEERREGERQMEALGAMLAGGDSQTGDLTDRDLIETHVRDRQGAYWIEPDGEDSRRPATPDEAARLEQLVGRRRQR